MQQWVDRALGKGKSYTLFYTDSKVKQYYKDWLKTIITRTNTITGQRYSEDPTVLAWELANEPRVGENYEKKNGLVPGRMLCSWVVEMSDYIK
jgi:mannan endo-1,4-beta-mannosidase